MDKYRPLKVKNYKTMLYIRINGKYKKVININEAKKILKVSRQRVLKMINGGWFRVVKYGKEYFIAKSDIINSGR